MNNTSNQSSIYSDTDIVRITSTSINLVLGVPINSWVLWLVLTGPAGTMASDFFPLNLSLCEIIFSLLCVPALVKRILLLDHFTEGLLFTGRPLFQCCICIERFMAVVHPVLFLKFKPLRYRVACSAVAWLLIVGFSLGYVLQVFQTIWYFVHLVKCLFFMSVMLLCSLAVLRALKQPMPGETGRERERDTSMKRRAFTIICLIMVSFVGTYFIWSILEFLVFRGLILNDSDLVGAVCVLITVVSGLVQPLLYLCLKTAKLPCAKPLQHT